MSAPGWLSDLFSAVMIAVVLYSVGRLVAARSWVRPSHRDVDVAHVLMGAAMAGMLMPTVNPLANGVWDTIFVVLALWFARKCYRFAVHPDPKNGYDGYAYQRSRRIIHLVMSLAMLYMYAVAAQPMRGSVSDGMAMGGATGTTTDVLAIPLLFLVALFASGIWELDGIERFAPRVPTPAPARPVEVGPDGLSISGPADPSADPLPRPDNPWLAPRLESGCHIVLCITMGYMLIVML